MTHKAIVASLLVAATAGNTGEAYAQTPPKTDGSVKASPSPYGGGDGSAEAPIVILLTDEAAGIRAEYSWIAEHYPGAKRLGQALLASNNGRKHYDRITIQTSEGKTVDLWFDITAML